jgi:hypothetical protein
MTYNYHYEYSDDVESRLEEVKSKIEEGVEQVWDTFDSAIGSKDWFWLISPAGKIAFEIAKNNIKDEVQKLWDDFTALVDDAWAKVEEFTGNPFLLMEMSASYSAAAGKIRDEKTVITRIGNDVAKHWEGLAFESYNNIVPEQTGAITAVDRGLVAASVACAEGAKQIRSIWRDFVDFLLDVVNTILDAIKDGTDAGQWVTFDAGPAIKVVGKCITALLALWNDMDRYFDVNVTTNTAMWNNLNAGVDGLDANNQWPSIPASESRDLDPKENWTQR